MDRISGRPPTGSEDGHRAFLALSFPRPHQPTIIWPRRPNPEMTMRGATAASNVISVVLSTQCADQQIAQSAEFRYFWVEY
jgi:hypothetical protein